jgi:hypothetical protein
MRSINQAGELIRIYNCMPYKTLRFGKILSKPAIRLCQRLLVRTLFMAI